jgi:signal transduction histidine kinase
MMSRKSFMAENVLAQQDVPKRLLASLSERDEELHYVARVLHEQIGQILTVVGLQIDLLRQDFSPQVPEIAPRATEVQQLLEKAIDEVRQLSYRLNPDIVQRSGLRYALDTLIGRFRESHPATIRLLMDSNVHLPQPVATAVYRIVEHAVDNAIRHSQANRIEIVLQQSGDVRLEISDNGKGFNLSQAMEHPKGLGLLWMNHLAAQAGLDLRLESSADQGTKVKASYHAGPALARAVATP